MKIVKFEDKEAVSVKALLEKELEAVDQIEDMIVIPILKNGDIYCGYTGIGHLKRIGILECIKRDMIEGLL